MNEGWPFDTFPDVFALRSTSDGRRTSNRTLRQGLLLQHLQIAPNKKIHIARISLRHFDVRVLSPLVSFGTDTTQRANNNPERAARGYYLKEYLVRLELNS